MIRPVNDFRIGNLVLDEDGELCKIEQLSSEKMECFQQVSNVENKSCISTKYPSNIYAIELTEEWLLKAGFEKDDSGVDMFDQDYCEWYQKEFPVIGIICQSHDKEYIFDENTDTLRLKYVHQLQNLYFALKGSELIFSTEP